MKPRQLRVVWTIARNDFVIWLRRPVVIFSTLVPSVMYILVIYFISVTVGNPPVALVNLDTGPQGAALQHIMQTSGDFRISPASPAGAKAKLKSLKVAAIVTIPADFDQRVAMNQPSNVSMEMNNLNEDIAGDLRRSQAATLDNLYKSQPGAAYPVTVSEHDTHAKDTSLAQFRIVPGLVLIVTIAGVVNTGLAICQEFEKRTIKELALAPTSRWSLVLGKIVGGWLTTMMVGGVMILVGIAAGLLHPKPLYWLPIVGMALIVGLAGSALGVATGAVVRKYQLVTSISVAISLYMFFLSGGISVPGFLPNVIQKISHFVPLYYGINALEEAVFNASMQHFVRDAGIMLAFTLASGLLAERCLRRPLVA